MSIEWSQLPDTVAAKPIQLKDIIVFSNTTDGGTTFDVSKQGFVEELLAFIVAQLGVTIPENIIAVGNSAGDGITESTGKAGGVVGFLDDFAIAHKDFFNDTEFLSYQDESGISYHSCATGQTVRLSVGISNKMTLADGGVQASVNSGDVVTVGLSIGGGTGAKLEVKGDGTTTGNTFLAKNDNDDTGLRVEDSGLVFFRLGTGVNEISIDSDFSGATDDQLATRLAVRAFVETSVVPAAPTTKTPIGTTETIDWNDGESQIIDLGSATADVTLTLNNPAAGQSYLIKFIQGATARDIVLPASVLIAGGTAPTTLQLTVIDDAEDTLTLWFDGTNYYAQFGENYG